MTDSQAVFSLFRQRYGSFGSDDDVKALCFTALQEILPLLKPGADTGDIRVTGAAAALAALRAARRENFASDTPSSFRAGDVSVTFSSVTAQTAENEYRQAIAALSPLLIDSGFYFGQVKI